MISSDKIKKSVLDFLFTPVDMKAPSLEPDTVFHLGDDPSLFDPARNSSAQQGDPVIRIYDDVTIWPAQSVAQKGKALASDTFMDEAQVDTLRKLDALRRYPTLRHRGWATAIESVYPTTKYYHFLIDSLPRVWSLRHPDLRQLPITLFSTRPLQAEKLNLLQSLLPPNVSLRWSHRFTRIHVDQYIHLPYLSKDRVGYSVDRVETSAGFIPQEYLDYFREHMLDRAPPRPPESADRIFVSRREADMRRLKNEEEVRGFLEQRGFQTVLLENYSLTEQARLFDSARLVVAQHGAALANLVYVRKGSVVEVFSSGDMLQHFSQCAQTLGLQYKPITLNRGWKNADAHLPVSKLKRTLAEIN